MTQKWEEKEHVVTTGKDSTTTTPDIGELADQNMYPEDAQHVATVFTDENATITVYTQ